MKPKPVLAQAKPSTPANSTLYYLRFHLPHFHLNAVFGNDWFALKAETFARFLVLLFF